MTIIESRPTGAPVCQDAYGWGAASRLRVRDVASATTPDALFVRGAAQQNAKIVCQKCPVIAECLADALDNRTEFGVWGGMTERERRAMLRRHPNVSSWWNLFQTARLTGARSRPPPRYTLVAHPAYAA